MTISRRALCVGIAGVMVACAVEPATPEPQPAESAEAPGVSSPEPPAPCGADVDPPDAPVYAFFTCADDDAVPPWDTHPVPRGAEAADPVRRLEAAFIGLLGGPTEAERAAGYTSWFSEETALALHGVSVEPDGTAVVDFADFRPFMGGASTSAGAAMLLSQLNATAFQVDDVAAVDYRIDGSCRLFWEWLQSSCTIVERPES